MKRKDFNGSLRDEEALFFGIVTFILATNYFFLRRVVYYIEVCLPKT